VTALTDEHLASADKALDTGELVNFLSGGRLLIAVPDVVMLEGLANGQAADGATLTIRRSADNRTVYIFEMPS
jgi:hypothetical protein